MRSGFLFVSLLSLSACTGGSGGTDTDRPPKDAVDTDDTDTTPDREITITIAAPAAGREFDSDQAVPLEVTAKNGSRSTDIDSATWTIGGWTGEGVSTQATGLPSGAHTVSVEAVIDGDTYTESVDITVLEPAVTVWAYAGVLEADVIVSTQDFGDFDDHCSTSVSIALDSGVLTGSGTCAVFDDFDFDPINFVMEGNVRSGAVTGALVMTFDGTEARTPFDGTGTAGAALTATFDSTHRDSGNSVRIVGSWSATPQ
ncbi:MAG: hypothetical protein Q8P18_27490 [Pseudomonadota bacterium]|nr:hypothetical protein [Pseudomonadota bacterium]